MHAPTLTIIALAAVLFAAVSRQAERRYLTASMVFAIFDLLVGPVGVDTGAASSRSRLLEP